MITSGGAVDFSDDIPPQLQGVLQDPLVSIPEECQPFHTQPIAGLTLLHAARLGELRRGDRPVGCCSVASGAQHVVDLFTFARPLADRACRD